MDVSVIAIGDELLIGQVTDTNSGDIARALTPFGWSLRSTRTVHDNAADIRDAITQAFAESDVVLTTGGLGPTKDDITKSTLRDIFGGEMVLDSDTLENVREVFRRRGLHMNSLTESQAMVPSSCTVIKNELGTAPVMWFERNGKVLVAMPGVPFETRNAFSKEVLPRLLRHFGQTATILHSTLIITDITESDLAERIAGIENALPPQLHLAYLPNPGYIRLRLDATGMEETRLQEMLSDAVSALRENLGDKILAEHDATPEEILKDMLVERGLTFATAESCTGGNIAHRFTMLPGASDVFAGGVVSYANEVKINVLGVEAGTIATLGAVSEPVAAAMAEGACRVLGTDCAAATSGIAGPGGGTPDKPVGTVCMAFATPAGTHTVTVHLPGDRGRVIDRASTTALIGMIKAVRSL